MDFTIFVVYNTCRHGVPQLMTQMEGQRQKLEHVVEALYLDDSLEEELNRLMEEMTEPPEVQAQAETMNLKIENSEAKTQASLSRLQDKNSLKLKKRVISQAKQLTDELLICFYFGFHIIYLFNSNN